LNRGQNKVLVLQGELFHFSTVTKKRVSTKERKGFWYIGKKSWELKKMGGTIWQSNEGVDPYGYSLVQEGWRTKGQVVGTRARSSDCAHKKAYRWKGD